MKRDLTFSGTGQLADALGCDPVRLDKMQTEIEDMINRDANLRQIIEHYNDRGDLTDSEWTAMVFSLGYFQGRAGD